LKDLIPDIQKMTMREEKQKKKIYKMIKEGLIKGLEHNRYPYTKFLNIDEIVDVYLNLYIKRYGLFFNDFFDKYGDMFNDAFSSLKEEYLEQYDEDDIDEDEIPYESEIDTILHGDFIKKDGIFMTNIYGLLTYRDSFENFYGDKVDLSYDLDFLHIFIHLAVQEGHLKVKKVKKDKIMKIPKNKQLAEKYIIEAQKRIDEEYEKRIRDAEYEAFTYYIFKRFISS
jgi:hypothetical protein